MLEMAAQLGKFTENHLIVHLRMGGFYSIYFTHPESCFFFFFLKKKTKTKLSGSGRGKAKVQNYNGFSSVAQLCLTLCDPMDCSTPGLPVYHQLPELT